MSQEYTLVRDIVSGHNERMHNIKKYYPFFRLSEISFAQYKDGKYEILDMGYILMAVLRFFIEENNFNEKATFDSMIEIKDNVCVIAYSLDPNVIHVIFKKISGTMITNNRFKNKSPKGLNIVAFSLNTIPMIEPTIIATKRIIVDL